MKPEHSDPLAAYPLVISVPVQWGDQDAFGHVNNTVYLRWLESARIAYCIQAGLAVSAAAQTIAPILASITTHFRRPVTFPDTVHVGARVSRIGRSSLTMDHAIVSENPPGLVADGSSVLVIFDYRIMKSAPVSDALRAAIARLEGKEL
jgi:acyl-CoA thioester hydrolase